MSYSNYSLNNRVSYLEYEIGQLAPIPIGGYVPVNTNSTINNVKTFTTCPKTAIAPVANDDIANKLYVDGLVGSIPTLSQVLLSNNSAGSTSINMNTNPISAISTATAQNITVNNITLNSNALSVNNTVNNGLLYTENYNQRTAVGGESIRQSFYAKNSVGAKKEYARISVDSTNTASTSERGTLNLEVGVGSSTIPFLSCNANLNRVNINRSLNMGSNGIDSVPQITTSNLNKYGVNSVNFYNTSNASIPPNTPDNNYKLTMINEGVPDVLTALTASFPSTWGNITASIQNFNGFTYVGTNQGNIYYSNDGVNWNDAGFSLDGQINAMVEFNSELIIGGTFTKEVSSGVFSYYICRMSSSNIFIPYLWANYPNLTGGFNNFVRCLFSNGGYLYVGGDFTNEINGGLSCPYIAIVDTGINLYCVDNSSGTGYGFNAPVNFIIVNANAPNRFVIGGEFSSMFINSGTYTTTYNAVWETNDYNTIVNPYEVIPLNNSTLCATTNGGSVYIGGYFTGNTYGDYLMNIEWDNVSLYVLVANPYGATPSSPINNILQNAGIFWTTLSGELYEANLLIGTSPFGGAYWEIIIPTVWGQTLFSTNSASQNPVIAYYLFTNNSITLTMAGGYLIQYSTSSFSTGIVLYGLGSVCEMIFNATNNTFYITTLLGATPF
jgi:hypothetical protein